MLTALHIDTSALRANARRIARFVAPARFSAVVKANAYGHGIELVARAIADSVEHFCVYRVSEARRLREAGIKQPILILGPIAPNELAAAHDARAAITLWDTGAYLADAAFTARRRGRPFDVHVKINTGINRLGLQPKDVAQAIALYRTTDGIHIAGVFSHLASAEELDSDFTLRQLERFETATPPAVFGNERPARHIAASAASILWPQTRLDLVRIGIAMYGLAPSPASDAAMREAGFHLDPALSWTSELVTVRSIDAGESVGYGATYVANSATSVGVVPIGYAEGIPRLASNRGAMLVNGVRCPVIGRVCMNMTVLDVSGVRDPRAGMRATVIGREGGATIAVSDWARWCETIDYEIVARLPAELPRASA